MLVAAVEEVLLQGCTFLDQMCDNLYTRPLDGPLSASLGTHYRHTLDHFLCLLEGMGTGLINYDERRRDPRVETSVAYARQLTEELRYEFRNLPTDLLQQDCRVVYSIGYEEDRPEAARSNLARETMFCVGHAIHHYAVLRLLCKGVGVQLPYEFGIAPSTLKHQEARAVRG